MTMQRAVCAAFAATVLALQATNAAPCPDGVTKPPVTTVMTAPEDPENVALIVDSDCLHSPVRLFSGGLLSFTVTDIDRVDGLATRTTQVLFSRSRLARGADFSGAKNLRTVHMKEFSAELVEDLKLPSQLDKLVLASSAVNSIDKVQLPDSLTALNLVNMRLTSLNSIPSRLRELELTGNSFSTINFDMPATLESLAMDRNPLVKLNRISFPDNLKEFSCYGCSIAWIRGVKWPKQLKTLTLSDNPIRSFEIRRSDFEVFSDLAELNVELTQVTCVDEYAVLQEAKSHKFCVIPDDRFEFLYSGSGTPPDLPSSGSSSKDTNSKEASGDASAANDGSDALPITNSTSSVADPRLQKATAQPSASENGSNGATAPIGDRRTKDAQSNTSKLSISSTLVGVLIGVGCVFSVLLAVFVFLHFRERRNNRDKASETSGNTHMMVDSPGLSDSQQPASFNSQVYLSNDIRNDKAMILYRIDQKHIALRKRLAHGHSGVIFCGAYNGRSVVVKQMLPDAWREESQLAAFMNEIRLCASLSHPKIVEFIGVAWSSQRDVSLIVEYMEGGDLQSVLYKHALAQSVPSTSASSPSTATASASSPTLSSSTSLVPSPSEWFKPWTAAAIKSKTLIAKDVAEALVYLHSFSNPIVHRDLKAGSILLDTQGNAKLNDFSVSREMETDEIMAREVGTTAWIAPEVLRGEQYNDRASIYSFGVLLVELDTCRHPYEGHEALTLMDGIPLGMCPTRALGRQALGHDTKMYAKHLNLQLARLASAGQLCPRPSEACPPRIQALIARCLSLSPQDRPSAMETHYELSQILAEAASCE